MRYRFFTTFMVAFALFIGVFASQAQTSDGCFGLSEADCALINEASAQTHESFYQNYSIVLKIVGSPEPIDLLIEGEGAVVLGDPQNGLSGLDQKVRFTLNNASGTQSGVSGVIFKDGMLYVDMGGGNYGSVNVMQLLSDPTFLGSVPGLDALSGGMDSGGTADPQQEQLMQSLMMATFMLPSLLETPDTVSYVREGDTFVFTLDVAKLLQSPQFAQILQSVGTMAGEEAAGQVQMVTLATRQIKSAVIRVTQTVDPVARRITGVGFTVDADIAGALLGVQNDVTVNFAFNLALSRFNESFTITAPANAMPLLPSN